MTTCRCWRIASAGPPERSSSSLPHRIVADARKLGPVTAAIRHLRPRGNGETQQTTTVELFFDLVYVFAVTQLSHQILGDLSVAGVARAAFLLLVVWWAWIYTTWMANWFDPTSSAGPRGADGGDARQPAHGRRATRSVR